MAASSVLTGNSLGLRYKVGVDAKGKDVFKEQNIKNISAVVTDDNLVGLSDAVGALLDFNISSMEKQQTYVITRG